MKNIHVLPKDIFNQLGVDHYGKTPTQIKIAEFLINKNIYITSDEEPKYKDFYITNGNKIYFCNTLNPTRNNHYKKIILTTDQDLIKDGVQAIDDEFIEWFVKNPSCERVEVERDSREVGGHNGGSVIEYGLYEIIIPKEEAKQETLKEVELAILFHNTYEKLAPSFGYETREDTKSFDITTPNGKLMIAVCKEIIKWQQETPIDKGEGEAYRQELFNYLHDNFVVIASESEMQEIERIVLSTQQERMYSEMDIVLILSKFRDMKMIAFSEWFEKFRKK